MGGRGGGGGPGPGTGAKNKKAGGGSAGGLGGGGGSGGSSGGGGKGTGTTGTGGVQNGSGGGGNGAGGGSSNTTKPVEQYEPMVIHFGEGLTPSEKAKQQKMLDELPQHAQDRLRETGTRVWVGSRADETPGWDGLAKATGWESTTQIADGREIGSLSFYIGFRNELFISVHYPGGSVNVYVHELGHAIDYQWTGDGKLISEDPDWVKIHDAHVWGHPKINSYYQGGPSGTSKESGRKELFAEGYAVYNKYGRSGLISWVYSEEAADAMIEIWKKYGVI
ncbi:hypothetical protein SEA_PRIAMO_2 [Mycobacterium phage Priamo]|uniref:Metalloprotease n=1 Tax=Mycobacterium phage Priamo TaxID=2182403 RepID=A0A2U8UQ99_9CAUD|nr:peptidase [Mycobacterium phage Priamo]AWN05770.1 hypothetical protein SEA_PRIAMO_2 [Mycobacterium phage Priamo]